jgi:hypothetical protein
LSQNAAVALKKTKGDGGALFVLRKFLLMAARDRSAEHCHPAESLQLAARH